MTALLLCVLVSIASGQELKPKGPDPGTEVIWRDAEIELIRVTIAPHSTSPAFIHARDYIFVPITNGEVIESVRPGTGHNPWSAAFDSHAKVSWVPRDTQVRFVHPAETEPVGGSTIFNDSDRPYVAIEIDVLDESMPKLQPRFSLFADRVTGPRSWRFGRYALTFQNVEAGAAVQFQDSSEGLLLSMSPVSLSSGGTVPAKRLNPGEPLGFSANANTYKNVTTFATTLLMIEKPAGDKLLAANIGQ